MPAMDERTARSGLGGERPLAIDPAMTIGDAVGRMVDLGVDHVVVELGDRRAVLSLGPAPPRGSVDPTEIWLG